MKNQPCWDTLVRRGPVGPAWTKLFLRRLSVVFFRPSPSEKSALQMASSPIKPRPPAKIGPPHHPLLYYLYLLPRQAVSSDVAHIVSKLIPWDWPRYAQRYLKQRR